MSKLGISIKIDVTKIDKSRIFEGQKGKYIDLTTFIDTSNVDQYDNNGFISQSVSKEEKAAGLQTPILGNCKVFYSSDATAAHNQGVTQVQGAVDPQANNGSQFDESDDIPF